MKTYTVKQVAQIVDRSPITVRRWIKDGKLPADRFPKDSKRARLYIKEIDIPAFLRK